MTKIWVVYMLLFGYGVPTKDEAKFSTESACQIYLHNIYKESIQQTFKLYCTNIGPLECQGKDCE